MGNNKKSNKQQIFVMIVIGLIILTFIITMFAGLIPTRQLG